MAKGFYCEKCKKKITGKSCIRVKNDHFPELKKELFFCNSRCYSLWKTSFFKQKTTEKLSKKLNEKYSDNDLFDILNTLNKSQKKTLLFHGFCLCVSQSDGTIQGIYDKIKQLEMPKK